MGETPSSRITTNTLSKGEVKRDISTKLNKASEIDSGHTEG
jgi:hypothetical protein